MTTLLIAGYALVAFVVLRLGTQHFAWMLRGRSDTWRYCQSRDCYNRVRAKEIPPHGGFWLGGFLMALFCAAIWPLTLLWCLPYYPTVGAAAREQAERQKRQIKELEQELERELNA